MPILNAVTITFPIRHRWTFGGITITSARRLSKKMGLRASARIPFDSHWQSHTRFSTLTETTHCVYLLCAIPMSTSSL